MNYNRSVRSDSAICKICRARLTLSSSGCGGSKLITKISVDELVNSSGRTNAPWPMWNALCLWEAGCQDTVKGSAVWSRSVQIVPKIAYSGRLVRVSCKSNKANKYCQNCSVLSALCVRGSRDHEQVAGWPKGKRAKGKRQKGARNCVRVLLCPCARLECVRHNMTWLFGPCSRLLDLAAASHTNPNSIGSRRRVQLKVEVELEIGSVSQCSHWWVHLRATCPAASALSSLTWTWTFLNFVTCVALTGLSIHLTLSHPLSLNSSALDYRILSFVGRVPVHEYL